MTGLEGEDTLGPLMHTAHQEIDRQYGISSGRRRRRRLSEASPHFTLEEQRAAANAMRLMTDPKWQQETQEKLESLRNATTLDELYHRGRQLHQARCPQRKRWLHGVESVARLCFLIEDCTWIL